MTYKPWKGFAVWFGLPIIAALCGADREAVAWAMFLGLFVAVGWSNMEAR